MHISNEDARRGAKTNAERTRKKALENYYSNPNICLHCGQVIQVPDGVKPSEIRAKKFCNSSCAASYNNKNRAEENKIANTCLNCGESISNQNKYCDNKCQAEFEYKDYIKKWKDNKVNGSTGKGQFSKHIKRYMFEKYESKCACCGWSKVNPYTNNIPLEIDHIDGNYTNNSEDNLVLLCPNCHSLTPTYKGANMGNGRTSRKKNGASTQNRTEN